MKLKDFEALFEHFKTTPEWALMGKTVEGTGWHREANVAVHTEMTLDQFRTRFAPLHSEHEQALALIALLFHDVGKPDAEEEKPVLDEAGQPTGMTRHSYVGHEQNSAVAFNELYVKSRVLRAALSAMEARAVRWIIEHHLPYGIKDVNKRCALAMGTREALAGAGLSDEVFYSCLRSDAAGRISDDMPQKLQNVEDWIAEFKTVPNLRVLQGTGRMFILTGPSGSGKSTWMREHKKLVGDVVICMDDLKEEFFAGVQRTQIGSVSRKEYYDLAWGYVNEHESEFKKFVQARVKAMMEARAPTSSVFIDITNLSKRVRTQWTDLGRRNKMHITGVEFWNSFDTLFARQATRPDKAVPWNALKQQVKANSLCYIGHEVDDVEIVLGE
jgi:predicted kinase